MPANLTAKKIRDTYNQLLHVDGGPAATEKVVYSGTGVATALRVGTGSVSVENLRLDGNTISALNTNGDIQLVPGGTGAVIIPKAQFTTLEGTTLSTVNAAAHLDIAGTALTAAGTDANINITMTPKGTGSVVLPKVAIAAGSASGLSLVEATKLAAKTAGDGIAIQGNTIAAEGTSTNLDISITPKGTGEVNVTNIDVLSGKVPFNTITNRAYASFYDAGTTDQTGSTTDRTAVKWATAAVAGAGITVASNSRITVSAAGTYRFNTSLQFNNSVNATHTVVVWFAKNGTDIASSAAKFAIPKSSEGGTSLIAYEIFETVAANDYIEMYWYTTNAGVTLHYVAPVAANPGVTPAIPAVPPAIVVVERIA